MVKNSSNNNLSPKPIHTIHYRPSLPGSLLADVISFFHGETYHVYYLRAGAKQHPWAHICSKDLVHWNELQDALIPCDDMAGIDYEGCWTGSVIKLKNGSFRIHYTGKNINDPLGDQKVAVADSDDLISWVKRPEMTFYADGNIYWSKPLNGAIDSLQKGHHHAFRDPEVVWNPKAGEWWMLLHACTADGSTPVFGLYASKDLTSWEPRQPLLACPEGWMSGDCPHFFEMNGRWYLLQAEHHYFFADEPEGPYCDELHSFDHGIMLVPKSMWDGKRRVIMGWLFDYEGFTDDGAGTWGGTMSMARELYTLPNGEMRQRPVAEVVAYFDRLAVKSDDAITLKNTSDEKQSYTVPANGMMHCQVILDTDSVLRIGLRESTEESGYAFTLDAESGNAELSSVYKKYCQPSEILPNKRIDIRAFILNDIIEVFVDDAWCYSMRAYDWSEGDLTFKAMRGNVQLQEFAFYSSRE